MTPAWLPLLLWPVGGAAAGVAVGVVITRPGAASALAGPAAGVLVVGAVAYGVYAGGRRLAERRRDRADRAPAPAAAAPAPDALVARLALPDVADGEPDVWGVGEPLRVRAEISRGAAPAIGAAVEIRADGRALATGATGEDGAFEAPFLSTDVRVVQLALAGEAAAARTVRVVRYSAEVQRIFSEFRAWANANVPGCRDALTAREVVDVMAPAAATPVRRALAEIARVYETVAYGERAADRALYLALVRAVGVLEREGVFATRARPAEA